jgi:hypothetical protein
VDDARAIALAEAEVAAPSLPPLPPLPPLDSYNAPSLGQPLVMNTWMAREVVGQQHGAYCVPWLGVATLRFTTGARCALCCSVHGGSHDARAHVHAELCC